MNGKSHKASGVQRGDKKNPGREHSPNSHPENNSTTISSREIPPQGKSPREALSTEKDPAQASPQERGQGQPGFPPTPERGPAQASPPARSSSEPLSLEQALALLAPQPDEYPEVEDSLFALEQRLHQSSSSSPVSSRRSFAWFGPLSATATLLFLFFLVDLLPQQNTLPPSSTRTSPGSPDSSSVRRIAQSLPPPLPSRNVLTPKGTQKKQIALHVVEISAQHPQGERINDGDRLSQSSSLALSFSLHGAGGYATLFWHRTKEPLVLLYQSQKRLPGNKLFPLLQGNLLVKFPLQKEKPGPVSLLLVQSHKPLAPKQITRLRHLLRSAKITPRYLELFFERHLSKNLITSRKFSFYIFCKKERRSAKE